MASFNGVWNTPKEIPFWTKVIQFYTEHSLGGFCKWTTHCNTRFGCKWHFSGEFSIVQPKPRTFSPVSPQIQIPFPEELVSATFEASSLVHVIWNLSHFTSFWPRHYRPIDFKRSICDRHHRGSIHPEFLWTPPRSKKWPSWQEIILNY